MITHRDLDRYCLMPYRVDKFDCADLVILVQRELFGRHVELPQVRPRGATGQQEMLGVVISYAVPTKEAATGDLVLMRTLGLDYPGHVGVFLKLDGIINVLHTTRKTGFSIVSTVSELAQLGIHIEGYYTWKPLPGN